MSSSTPPISVDASTLPTPQSAAWESYTYTPTEKNIFAPSPYKDLLLPHWRFATPAAAKASAEQIYEFFLVFEAREDFVGADNARKFLQMGMTRAGRYANFKGGRKYTKGEKTKEDEEGVKGGKGKRKVKPQEGDWEGRKEKREASDIFRGYWEKAKGSEGYLRLKEEFMKGKREGERKKKTEEAGG